MALKKDLSSLPTDGDGGPDVEFVEFLTPLIAATLRARAEEDARPMAVEGADVRASWAEWCERRIAYEVQGITPEPTDEASQWNFLMGQWIHDFMDEHILAEGGEVEVVYQLEHDGVLLAGHADGYLNGKVIEAKSVNGYGYKMQVARFRGGPEGAKSAAIAQGALAVKGILEQGRDVDGLIVPSFGKETISKTMADTIATPTPDLGRFMAETFISVDEALLIAQSELERMARVVRKIREGEQVRRIVPNVDGQIAVEIRDPMSKKDKGSWVITDDDDTTILFSGHTWHCGYCDHRATCANDGR